MVTSRPSMTAAVAAAAMLLACGCASAAGSPPATASRTDGPAASSLPASAAARAGRGARLIRSAPHLPRFSATVSGPLSRRDVPFSWRHGCPVPPRKLREIRLSYVGFDGSVRTGKIIVNATVVKPVIKVFAILYRHRFPIRRMEPVDVFHGSDPRSMAADTTSGFNCRRAVAPGPPQWSMHAYGLAIDVNTVQNPYVEAGVGVQPPAGAAYTNRSDIRPGMAYPGGILVRAFKSIGWGWGGDWSGSPDYQHFSVNGH